MTSNDPFSAATLATVSAEMQVQTLCDQIGALTEERDRLRATLNLVEEQLKEALRDRDAWRDSHAKATAEFIEAKDRFEDERDRLRVELKTAAKDRDAAVEARISARTEADKALGCIRALARYLGRPRDEGETIDAWWRRLSATLHEHLPSLYDDPKPCDNPHCVPYEAHTKLMGEKERLRRELRDATARAEAAERNAIAAMAPTASGKDAQAWAEEVAALNTQVAELQQLNRAYEADATDSRAKLDALSAFIRGGVSALVRG